MGNIKIGEVSLYFPVKSTVVRWGPHLGERFKTTTSPEFFVQPGEGIKFITDGALIWTKRETTLMSESRESYRQGFYRESYQKLQTLVEINPRSSSLALCGRLLEKLEEIVEILPRETRTGKIPRLVRTGITAYLEGKLDLALEALVYAGQLEPERQDLPALTRLVRKEYPRMLVLEKGKNLVETKLSQMLTFLLKKNYETAAQRGEKILLLEPDNFVALTRLGSAYYGLGEKEEAREMWRKALKINPQNQELINFLRKAGEYIATEDTEDTDRK